MMRNDSMATVYDAMAAVYDASELATYAGITGNKDWARDAQALAERAAQPIDGLPDDRTHAALIENDPVSAVVLRWLRYSELKDRVVTAQTPYLYPDEAEAVR